MRPFYEIIQLDLDALAGHQSLFQVCSGMVWVHTTGKVKHFLDGHVDRRGALRVCLVSHGLFCDRILGKSCSAPNANHF